MAEASHASVLICFSICGTSFSTSSPSAMHAFPSVELVLKSCGGVEGEG